MLTGESGDDPQANETKTKAQTRPDKVGERKHVSWRNMIIIL